MVYDCSPFSCASSPNVVFSCGILEMLHDCMFDSLLPLCSFPLFILWDSHVVKWSILCSLGPTVPPSASLLHLDSFLPTFGIIRIVILSVTSQLPFFICFRIEEGSLSLSIFHHLILKRMMTYEFWCLPGLRFGLEFLCSTTLRLYCYMRLCPAFCLRSCLWWWGWARRNPSPPNAALKRNTIKYIFSQLLSIIP